jgi:hypothetical protein
LESVIPVLDVAGAEDVVEKMRVEVLLVTAVATFVEANDIIEEQIRNESEEEEEGTGIVEFVVVLEVFKVEVVELAMAELAVDFVDA